MTLVNMDPVVHDIQAYEMSHFGPRVLFHTPLPMNLHHRCIGTAPTVTSTFLASP